MIVLSLRLGKSSKTAAESYLQAISVEKATDGVLFHKSLKEIVNVSDQFRETQKFMENTKAPTMHKILP